MVNFVPFQDYLLLKENKVQETRGGIALPDSGGDEFDISGKTGELKTAVVAAVGPGRWEMGMFIEPSCKVGDTVALGGLFFKAIKFKLDDGEKYVLCRDRDVIGRV